MLSSTDLPGIFQYASLLSGKISGLLRSSQDWIRQELDIDDTQNNFDGKTQLTSAYALHPDYKLTFYTFRRIFPARSLKKCPTDNNPPVLQVVVNLLISSRCVKFFQLVHQNLRILKVRVLPENTFKIPFGTLVFLEIDKQHRIIVVE